jgi:signal transduction histidine kinase
MNVEVFSKNTKITITDTGIGINDTNEIFKPFVRGKNADNIQGTGLGLSIVKEAVKKHKGKINVITKVNEGTSIEVILPNTQEPKN